MALTFGSQLDDVTMDEDAMRVLLEDGPGTGVPEYEPDPDPGFEDEGESLASKVAGKVRGAAKPVRVTAALRKDVQAKTALLLAMGAGAWQMRDEHCGSVMLESVPEVSKSLADIFCDSPEIVRWFSAGTGYLKWLNLAAALQPVAGAVWGHHVTHSIATEDADWSAYAAA